MPTLLVGYSGTGSWNLRIFEVFIEVDVGAATRGVILSVAVKEFVYTGQCRQPVADPGFAKGGGHGERPRA